MVKEAKGYSAKNCGRRFQNEIHWRRLGAMVQTIIGKEQAGEAHRRLYQ